MNWISLLYFLVSIWSIQGAYITENYVDYQQYYLDIPRTIFHGLLTEGAKIKKIYLINGTCLQYDPYEFDRCTYYGDCCPFVPLRVKKQLPLGTFSCHTGFYIVDKCPHGTESELRGKCETTSASGLDLEAWPVSSTTTQLAYKNVYCAMCHGLDPVAMTNLNETFHTQNHTDVPSVEWWATKTECELDSIKKYLENRPNHDKLMQFIRRSCQTYYIPPTVPDLCWEATRFCPTTADKEFTRLCEQGPANYMLNPVTGEKYRNQFCAMCQDHMNSTDVLRMVPLEFLNQVNTNTSLEFQLHSGLLKPSTGENSMTVLAVVKLTPYEDMISLNEHRRSPFQTSYEFRCRQFVDESLNFCIIDIIEQRPGQEHLGWNLGSLLCQSSFGKVCDVLTIKRKNNEDCDLIGCAQNSLPDAKTKDCQSMPAPPLQRVDQRDKLLTWQGTPVCNYYSRCKAVEQGLITESELNCYCDKFCPYFNDCCEDSNYQPTPSSKLERGTYSCQLQDGHNDISAHRDWGLMVVNKCPSRYTAQHNFNGTVKEHCESKHYNEGFSLLRLPVTDILTEIVYQNVYCAMCNGVEDILYWRTDIGTIRVMNDSCHYYDAHWSSKIKALRANPSVKTLKESWWSVKQYLPPLTQLTYRKCSSLGEEYVETCPAVMNTTLYEELCLKDPASFVFEAIETTEFLKYNTIVFGGTGSWRFNAGQEETVYYKFQPRVVYRNSYCAACHDALIIGCQVRNYQVLKEEEIFQRYVGSPNAYMLIYRIDLNQQTCERLSDGRAVYGVAETGWDTCLDITKLLRSCDNNEVYDIDTEKCEALLVPGQDPLAIADRIPPIACAGKKFETEILPLHSALTTCNACSQNTSCQKVPIASVSNSSLVYPSMHCAAEVSELAPPNCENFQIEDCAIEMIYGGVGDSEEHVDASRYQSSIKSDNFISIRYQQVEHTLSIEHPEVDRLGKLFSVYQKSNEPVCLKYESSYHSNTNTSEYLVCDDGSVTNLDTLQSYPDFQLKGYNVETCVEYVEPGLHLAPYDFILTSISILCGLIYVTRSIAKLEHKKISSYIAISTILAVIFSLIAYCFINISNDTTGCMVIALLCQYFFLCVHTWSNAWAVMLVKGILVTSAVPKKQSRLACSLYAWLAPLLLVMLSLVLHYTKAQPFYPVFTEYVCFISAGPVRALVFTGPIYTLILINLVICVLTSYKVLRSGRSVKNTDKQRNKKRILTILKLQMILGFHWILLYFAEIPGPQQRWLWETVTILISLQGVLLVTAQLMNMNNVSKLSTAVRSCMEAATTTSGGYK